MQVLTSLLKFAQMEFVKTFQGYIYLEPKKVNLGSFIFFVQKTFIPLGNVSVEWFLLQNENMTKFHLNEILRVVTIFFLN